MQALNFRFRFKLISALTLLIGATFLCSTTQAQVHKVGITKLPLGPNGTAQARQGETITATITVLNENVGAGGSPGSSIVVTSIIDIIHYAPPMGDVTTNLMTNNTLILTSPLGDMVIISNPTMVTMPAGFTLTVTNSYPAQPGQDQDGMLKDDAIAAGIDNHDISLGDTGIMEGFGVTFPGQILVTNACPPCDPVTLISIRGCFTNCVLGATSDPAFLPSGKPPGRNQALWMKGISTNLVFLAPDFGKWFEDTNGTATFVGKLVSLTNLSSGFYVTNVFSGYTTNPPPGNPKLDANPAVYTSRIPPIQPSTWHYYPVLKGTLTGFGFWQGAKLTLTALPGAPAFQVGVGANGKNGNFGASGWFTFTIDSQPTSTPRLQSAFSPPQADFNLDIFCCPP